MNKMLVNIRCYICSINDIEDYGF